MDNDWTKVLSFPGYRIYKYEIDEQRITWRRGFCASPELKACEGPFPDYRRAEANERFERSGGGE